MLLTVKYFPEREKESKGDSESSRGRAVPF